MGGFKRALFGYRREEVDAVIAGREARIGVLEREASDADERWRQACDALARAEAEQQSLADMVLERERQIRNLEERLREANERHERSIASLASTASRLEEINAQARGQATRIRMKALREAVEVSRRTQELADAQAGGGAAALSGGEEGGEPASDRGEGAVPAFDANGLFEGRVKLEIGPLGDFSQLVGIEDLIGALGASEISVERFTEGRATLSLRLDEPVELLRELEERAPLEFRVRRTSQSDVVLDVDEEQGPEQQAA